MSVYRPFEHLQTGNFENGLRSRVLIMERCAHLFVSLAVVTCHLRAVQVAVSNDRRHLITPQGSTASGLSQKP